MFYAIVAAMIVLLNLVSAYTFIHILLGTAILCVLAKLVYGPRSGDASCSDRTPDSGFPTETEEFPKAAIAPVSSNPDASN